VMTSENIFAIFGAWDNNLNDDFSHEMFL
jgi:hypothetical protein